MLQLTLAPLLLLAVSLAITRADGTCSVVPGGLAVGANATCEVLLADAAARLQLERVPPLSAPAQRGSLPSDTPDYLDAQVFAHSVPPRAAAPPRKAVVANIISGAANKYSMTDETTVALALAAAQASSAPLDVILFPECFLYNGSNAEVCDGPNGSSCRGPHATACAQAARATNSYVVCPFYELASANSSQDMGPMWNTAILLDRTGVQVGKYRKFFPTAEIFPPSTGEVNEGVLPGDLGVPVFDVSQAKPSRAITVYFLLWVTRLTVGYPVVFCRQILVGLRFSSVGILTFLRYGMRLHRKGRSSFYGRLLGKVEDRLKDTR
jgi:hypothetical protein